MCSSPARRRRSHTDIAYYSLVLSGALSVSFIARTALGDATSSVQILVLYELLLYPVVIGAYLRTRASRICPQRHRAAAVATVVATTAGLYGGVLAGVGHLLFSSPSTLSTLQHMSFAVGSLLVTGLLIASPLLLPPLLRRLRSLGADRSAKISMGPVSS